MKILNYFLILFFSVHYINLVLAYEADFPHNDGIPENLIKVKIESLSEVQKLTILSAFVGGILLFFAPCSIGLLPAYFASTFKNKTNLVLMTLAFFIGFASFNAFLGLGASILGNWILIYQPKIVLLSGLLIIVFGLMLIFGISFSLFNMKNKIGNSFFENIIFGALFSFGYAGCAGPIVFSILTLASTLPIILAAFLMFVYSLGMSIPLIIISLLFDKIKIFDRSIFRKSIEFKLFEKTIYTSVTNIIGGLIFVLLGLVYLVYNSTGVFHQIPLNISQPIYDFVYDKQKLFVNLFSSSFYNIIGISLIAIIFFFIVKSMLNSSTISKNKRGIDKFK